MSSSQHKLDRVRRRHPIMVYDATVGGAAVKRRLPSVVGVLAGLSGSPSDPISSLADREFLEIDRDNFDAVLARLNPRLAFRVNDLIRGEGTLAVELRFREMDDFAPERVLAQVEPLRKLLESRSRRDVAIARAEPSPFVGVLRDILSDLTGTPKERAPAAAKHDSEAGSLLDKIIAATHDDEPAGARESTPPSAPAGPPRVAQIDALLSRQLNTILHHESFRRLEAAWRGLRRLVHESETDETLKIKVLDIAKDELLSDSDQVDAFDKTVLFQQVHGGIDDPATEPPFAVLIGDYEFTHDAGDLALLRSIASTAQSAHALFVASAGPGMFQLQSFTDLTSLRTVPPIFEADEYSAWNAFRDSDESRCVVLTLPRILARLPYGAELASVDGFSYEELIDGKANDQYLWSSAAFAFAARLTDAFARDDLCINIRGVEGGGRVDGLPVMTSTDDDGDVCLVGPTQVAISSRYEFELSSSGFLPLVPCPETDFAVFSSSSTCHRPKPSDDSGPAFNALIQAQIPSVLVPFRFAHYVRAMSADLHGRMSTPELESHLNRWIANYVAPESTASSDQSHPLTLGQIEVKEITEAPVRRQAILSLRPSFPDPSFTGTIRVVVDLD